MARAQRTLVERQLQQPETVAPFVQFKAALAVVAVRSPLLDVGCGVGHYGRLCSAWFPEIDYFGTDVSAAMIAAAREFYPEGGFRACAFEDNDFGAFPLVLVGQVMEYTVDPWLSLQLVLERMGRAAILHRLRVTLGPSGRTPLEETYCGHYLQNYAWNVAEVEALVRAHARLAYSARWEGNLTMVVERP